MYHRAKLMIQVREKESFYVSGTVFEDGSKERLYGAVVSLDDGKGKQWNCISDGNGVFKLYAPEGVYKLSVSYMGYNPYSRQVRVDKDRFFTTTLKPLLFEIEEVTVESNKRSEELGELTPSNMLAFSGNDLFSQIWILPGVTSSLAGSNLQVDGGSNDENQFLLDGVPVFHPGHINSLLPIFNGDAVKNMVFHKGFFDTHLEGRLSSVTEVNLKEGNKQEHVGTLTLDMPAASATLEGPIVKDKLSYMVSARRSWLDFFDRLLSEENRLNHASYDYNAKLSYALSKVSSLSFLAYGARDDYHLPLLDEEENTSVLRWENQVYQLAYHTQAGKLGNRTAVFYSSHTNRARSEMLGTDTAGYIRSGIRSVNVSTEFDYAFENIYRAQWGAKYSHEVYELASFDTDAGVRHEPVNQVSLFYDNHIRISPRLSVQVGVHGVGYLPRNHRPYYSIQPRMSVKYFPGEEDMLYFNFSKMEQFYHCLRLFSWDLLRISACRALTVTSRARRNTTRRDGSISSTTGCWRFRHTTRHGGMWWPCVRRCSWKTDSGRSISWWETATATEQDVFLQELEAVEAATVVYVRTESGVVRRAARQRQDAFDVRHSASAEHGPVVSVEHALADFGGRYDAFGKDAGS